MTRLRSLNTLALELYLLDHTYTPRVHAIRAWLKLTPATRRPYVLRATLERAKARNGEPSLAKSTSRLTKEHLQ